MDYRRSSLVLNRQHQTTSNSHIYASFAGVGTPRDIHGNIFETSTMWWDEERIDATVTRQFVQSKLRPDEQVRLDEQLGFGDGLTDDTYMEWIEQKAKRIFLILVDLGVPDQIFGVVDDSWDDDDLPVPLDQVERLQLTYDKDEKLEKKFFHRQFYYLLRNIQKGEHVYYDDEEVVPLEQAEKRPIGAVAGLTHTNMDKVHLPGRPDDLLVRRRIPLGITAGRMPQEEFLSGIEAMKVIDHPHLTSLWASYVHQGNGYLLLTPVNDSTLKSFLTVTPQSIKIMAKQDRRILMLNWIHCLAEAVSFLHSQGLAHRNIKPSTVMLDVDNQIFLGDCGIFPTATLEGGKQGFDKEAYDYSAPEQGHRSPVPPPIQLPVTRPSTARCSGAGSPTYFSYGDTASMYSSNSHSHTHSHSHSRPLSSSGSISPPSRPRHDPQMADIFSLGSIFLEILTFLLKRTSKNFASHRSAKNKLPGRGGGLPDSSFHKNLGQLESWMATLSKDSSKKEDKLFRGVSQIITLTGRMVHSNPEERPNATEVKNKIYEILTQNSGLEENMQKIHCQPKPVTDNEWNFGFEELRLASQRAAAEACASVNAVTANGGTLGLNSGVIYGVERTSSIVGSMGITRVTSGGTGTSSGMLSRSGSGIGYGLLSRSTSGIGKKESTGGDGESIQSKTSRSSESKSRSGSGSMSPGGRIKPKAKAWQAPVYAELSFA